MLFLSNNVKKGNLLIKLTNFQSKIGQFDQKSRLQLKSDNKYCCPFESNHICQLNRKVQYQTGRSNFKLDNEINLFRSTSRLSCHCHCACVGI